MDRSDSLMKISNLDKKKFFIPSYQRGYKWDPKQAKELLDDIDEFIRSKQDNEIYCIQPLVVKQEESGIFNVVDGQQRLTTIWLILSSLGSGVKYSITYQTRENSASFLSKTLTEMKKEYEDNIDYYHIYMVKQTVDEWCGSKSREDKGMFCECLEDSVCFIWYEIAENETEEDVFRRTNEGKIPHTDAELIKGLLLNSYNYAAFAMDAPEISDINHKIAMEWDQIEYSLQDDEFWLFINKNYDEDREKKRPARIEFIFDLAVDMDLFGLGKVDTGDRHRAYVYFEKLFRERAAWLQSKKETGNLTAEDRDWVGIIWTEIKSVYQILDEWYHDPTIFHYAGYLISVRDKAEPKELIEIWKKTNKEEFAGRLAERIKDHLKSRYEKTSLYDSKKGELVLDEFSFEEGKGSLKKQEARDLLLLHNVETVLRQNEYLKSNKKYNMPNFTKFDFHLYKREKWEIEHIRPNSDNRFASPDDIELYLRYAKISGIDFSSEELDAIDSLLRDIESRSRPSDELINDFEENIRGFIDEKDGGGGIADTEKNKLWNYALLDESTNSGYGNYIFPIKRAYMFMKEKGLKLRPGSAAKRLMDGDPWDLELETERTDAIPFVPPCTRYVFTKYYNMKPTSFIGWTKDDAKAYLNNMEELLEKFGVRRTVNVR